MFSSRLGERDRIWRILAQKALGETKLSLAIRFSGPQKPISRFEANGLPGADALLSWPIEIIDVLRYA